MDYALFRDNLKRILGRGKYGSRKVDVAVINTALKLVEENTVLRRKLAAIEAISNGVPDLRAA